MLREELNKHFGFAAFLKGQEEVIQRLLAGQSAVAIFPTGAGKSLCYQLPALLLEGLTLVVSPLLSLMKDQVDFLAGKNIPAARLDSTLSREEFNRVLEQARQGRLKILMISVERFKNERFRVHLQRLNISLLVVDEAHCISEWGHNFRPEYLKLPDYRLEFAIRQVLLLTATATPAVVDDMCRKFTIDRSHVTATGFYRPNLFLQVTPVQEKDKDALLLRRLHEAAESAVIVYVTLQKTAERLADFLQDNGIDSSPYHAGMDSAVREGIQQRFMESGGCIVATIAFGMGIDKKDIRRVIHYDLPKSLENYSQETGRAGRDGKLACCEVLANLDRLNILENFIYGDTPEREAISRLLRHIKESSGPYEIKLYELADRLNTRLLPLKTMLVYLDMAGVLQPQFSYLQEYSCKLLSTPEAIIAHFTGERKSFVAAIFASSQTKKTWTYIDIPDVISHYQAERQRIVTALEYFDEKGWLELKAGRNIEVYQVTDQTYEVEELTEKIFRIFKEREAQEIKRLHAMIAFFENAACISYGLAAYFGEAIQGQGCGHCSACRGEKAVLSKSGECKALTDFDLAALTSDFLTLAGRRPSAETLSKFLLGISMPAFNPRQLKKLPGFGALEAYPFQEVRAWIEGKGNEGRP